jgi:DNA repair exonuclease SbcCD ATPase subunit
MPFVNDETTATEQKTPDYTPQEWNKMCEANARLRQSLEFARKCGEEQAEILRDLEIENKKLNDELKGFKSICNEYLESEESSWEQLAMWCDEKTEEIVDLKEEIDDLEEKVEELEAQVEELEAQVEELEDDVDRLSDLEIENKKLKEENDKTEGVLEQLQQYIEWFDDIEDILEVNDGCCVELVKELKEEASHYDYILKHRDTLLEESEESFMKIHKLEEENEKLKEENEKLDWKNKEWIKFMKAAMNRNN